MQIVISVLLQLLPQRVLLFSLSHRAPLGGTAEGSINILSLSIYEQSPSSFLLCQLVITLAPTCDLKAAAIKLRQWYNRGRWHENQGYLFLSLIVPLVPLHVQSKHLPFLLAISLLLCLSNLRIWCRP